MSLIGNSILGHDLAGEVFDVHLLICQQSQACSMSRPTTRSTCYSMRPIY
jgi:hypothetical protein